MRKLVFGLILALGVTLFPAGAHADTVTDEASFVAKINDLRAGKGLPALQVNANLVAKARGWAAGMAAAGRIWHSTLSDGITADWQKLGENVGMGGSVDGLHAAFVASPHHYENLVDPDFGYVGIGIAMSGSTMFVSEEFMELMPAKVTLPSVTVPKLTTTTTASPSPPPCPSRSRPSRPPRRSRPPPSRSRWPRRRSLPPLPGHGPPPPPVTPPAPPAATPAAPADPPRAPSALLVSVFGAPPHL